MYAKPTLVLKLLLMCCVGVLIATNMIPSTKKVCANFLSIEIHKFYVESDANTPLPYDPSICRHLLKGQGEPILWQVGFAEYLNGNLKRAEEDLSSALASQNDVEQMLLLDKILTLAPLLWHDDAVAANFAVSFARQHDHTSPIGYLRLANFYITQRRSGVQISQEAIRPILQLAGETNVAGHIPLVKRAEAWFYLGELWKTSDQQKALIAYQNAIATDPKDMSWGYAWMSAMQIVEIHISQQAWADAQSMLTYAESLPNLYQRYSKTRLRLAQLESDLGRPNQAIAILEETIARDPAFVPTRLHLAGLYVAVDRAHDGITQYREVLKLDPNQIEAQEALATLEGKQ